MSTDRTHAEVIANGMGEENARRLARLLKQGKVVSVRIDDAHFDIMPRQFAGVWCQFGPRPAGKARVIKSLWRSLSEDNLVEWLLVCQLPFDPGQQPGELTSLALQGITIDQATCAKYIPDRVFEAAKVCRFAFPKATVGYVADRLASYYGYTDSDARHAFINAITCHLTHA